MSPPRRCLDCGNLTTATRCPRCKANRERHRNRSRTWYSSEYRAASARLLAAWRATYGDVCPGDEYHAAHPCTDLTADHGDSHHNAVLTVKCRSENSRQGARLRY